MNVRRVIISFLFVSLVCFNSFAANSSNAGHAWQRDLSHWRAQYTQDLLKPDGWLSVVGLEWLDQGNNSIGTAADNKIKLRSTSLPHLGTIQLQGNHLMLIPPSGGYPKNLLINKHAPARQEILSADDAERPSRMVAGSLTLTVIHRGDRYGLRVKDSKTLARTNFRGLHWYAPNPAYRVRARWIPYNPPQQRPVPTVLGTTVNMVVPGAVEFVLEGKTLRLEPVLESPTAKELFYILRDSTSKHDTYGAGRFLYSDLPNHGLSKPGEIWLDFNRLTNPPCAYTPYATCPLPPQGNRLSIAIPAGERRFHD